MITGSKLEHGAAHRAAHDRWTRRSFLSSLGLATGSALMIGSTPVHALQPTPLMAHLHQEQSDRILVLVQLFGGNDGLNTWCSLTTMNITACGQGCRFPSRTCYRSATTWGFTLPFPRCSLCIRREKWASSRRRLPGP